MIGTGSDSGLRVALMNPCYWPEVRRGSERFVRELATGLLARGHHPVLITSHRGRPSSTVEDGLPVRRLPRPPQGFLLRAHFEHYLTHVPLSYLALRGGAFDVAHAMYPTDALAAARWAKRAGRPAVLSYMGIPERAWIDAARLRRAVLERAVRECDAVVVLSRFAADALRDSVGVEPRVIPPGVDVTRFGPSPDRHERPTIVCTAAPEVPRKHVALLIEAFALVRREQPEARLVLSRPRDVGALLRAGFNLETPGVEWTDLDHDEALARAYAEASVAVLPAVDEAFGLVLVEALACGTPVVGYDGGGIPEIVDRPETGRLFGELRPEALARALLETLELSRDPRTAASCRRHAEEFSLRSCVERYLGLYSELTGGRPLGHELASPPDAVAVHE